MPFDSLHDLKQTASREMHDAGGWMVRCSLLVFGQMVPNLLSYHSRAHRKQDRKSALKARNSRKRSIYEMGLLGSLQLLTQKVVVIHLSIPVLRCDDDSKTDVNMFARVLWRCTRHESTLMQGVGSFRLPQCVNSPCFCKEI